MQHAKREDGLSVKTYVLVSVTVFVFLYGSSMNWCGNDGGGSCDDIPLIHFTSKMNIVIVVILLKVTKAKIPSIWKKQRPSKSSITKTGFLILSLLAITLGIYHCIIDETSDGEGGEEYDSHFTIVTISHLTRLEALKTSIVHYSRCSSVHAIIIVWSGEGTPPKIGDFDSKVPLYIRVEEHNSLNNRFKPDPRIRTRAVLSLDDDIIIPCDDIDRGFQIWKLHPDRIVGFFPRLATGNPLRYKARKARNRRDYNLILTNAAFLDGEVAFDLYWSDEAARGRMIVDMLFNCEDILMNYLFSNRSSSASHSDNSHSRVVEFLKPSWYVYHADNISSSGISGDGKHRRKRRRCLRLFSKMYGYLNNNE